MANIQNIQEITITVQEMLDKLEVFSKLLIITSKNISYIIRLKNWIFLDPSIFSLSCFLFNLIYNAFFSRHLFNKLGNKSQLHINGGEGIMWRVL